MKRKITSLGTHFILRMEENGEGTIAVNGSIFSADHIAVKVITDLEKGLSFFSIVEEISNLYKVDKNTIDQDIKDFLIDLHKYITITNKEIRDIINV
ncbi:PqqD family peptide modification chaperone [Saccharibacillus alkalitolerans]|uniref:PqqD family protein n=1 Tax=Saccharibacillus alkalitolerans TaxID=2705290 RepID=A0ABX0F7H8_9BACL|nr:PqqD family peptide modification chaperone [Saccharibacillus alkalitolerans]NGZ76911.1 hypothetical protein [Saccharibacillus alkalitolerans]